eukprot:g56077.t1
MPSFQRTTSPNQDERRALLFGNSGQECIPSLKQLADYFKVCGTVNTEAAPPVFHFASSLPLLTHVLNHAAFPLKPMATYVHTKQTVHLLKPIPASAQNVHKRVVFRKFERTEKGTLLEVAIEVYLGGFMPENMVGMGVSTLLVLAPRKKGEKKPEEESKDVPQVTKTHQVSLPANQGRIYAPTTGDYNPW